MKSSHSAFRTPRSAFNTLSQPPENISGAKPTPMTSAGTPLGGGTAGAGAAGGSNPVKTSRPRSNTTTEQIHASNDILWLRRMLSSDDNPLSLRKAAERRLKQLVRKPKL